MRLAFCMAEGPGACISLLRGRCWRPIRAEAITAAEIRVGTARACVAPLSTGQLLPAAGELFPACRGAHVGGRFVLLMPLYEAISYGHVGGSRLYFGRPECEPCGVCVRDAGGWTNLERNLELREEGEITQSWIIQGEAALQSDDRRKGKRRARRSKGKETARERRARMRVCVRFPWASVTICTH